MATTRLDDIIVPEVLTPYTIQRTAELSNIINSGIATRSAELDSFASGGGQTINLPYWTDLSGDAEIFADDGTPLAVNNIGTSQQTAVITNWGKAWGANFLAHYTSGDDPMARIGELVAGYWAREDQKHLLSILKALFLDNTGVLFSSHVNDQSTTALTNNMLIDARAKLGDASNQLGAMICHSQIYHSLVKLDLLQYVNSPSNTSMTIPTYMGMRVIVDDGVEVTGVSPNFEYRTYIFGSGAIAYGMGSLDNRDATEVDRDSLASEDILISRRRTIMHPAGFKWTGTAAGSSPTYAELATPGNWTQVFEDKKVPVVCLISGAV